MSPDNFILLVFACLAVNLSPGPSVMLVSSVSAARGFRAGVFAVLGMTAGAFVHVLLAASGLAALLSTSSAAFTTVQYLGAAYLIYLGVDLLRPQKAAATAAEYHGGVDPWAYFRRGFLVDSLNPKIALFFLAFIPQFLTTVETPGFRISLALGSVFLLTGAVVNGTLAFVVAAGSRHARGPLAAWVQRWIPGGVLVCLGLRLVWQES